MSVPDKNGPDTSGPARPDHDQEAALTEAALDGAPSEHAPVASPEPTKPEKSPRTYPSRPIVGVGAVIIEDGKVVLIKRRYEPLAGQWSLPGGTLDVGETLEAGVAREMLEETGLDVEVGPVIDVFDRIMFDDEQKVRYHFVLVDYLCRPRGGILAAASDVTDAVYVHPDNLAEFKLTAKAEEMIRKGFDLWRRIGGF
jgi:8-oxo-dGTP diphosphatase